MTHDLPESLLATVTTATDLSSQIMLTLFHFLWQGLVIAVIAGLIDCVLPHRRSRIRYAVHVTSLLLMMVCAAATFVFLSPPADSPPALATAHRPSDREAVGSHQRQQTTRNLTFMDERPSARVQPAGDAWSTNGTGPEDITISRIPIREQQLQPKTGTELTPPVGAEQASASRAGSQWQLYSPLAAIVYAAGVGVMMLRLLVSLLQGIRLRRAAEPIRDNRLLRLLKEQAQAVGMRTVPLLASSADVTIPLVIGILRPVILLPCYAVSGLTENQLRALFSHELAHIRRYDLIVNLLQRICESVLFFHPAVWWVSRRISVCREHCCDDAAVESGISPAVYAESLIRTTELFVGSRRETVRIDSALAMADVERPSEFRRRIMRLIGQPDRPRQGLSRSAAAMLLFALAVGSVTTVVIAAQSEPLEESTMDPAVDEVNVDSDRQPFSSRHSLQDLQSYPSFTRFCVRPIDRPVAEVDTRGFRPVELFVPRLEESEQLEQAALFHSLMNQFLQGQLTNVKTPTPELIRQSRELHPMYQTAAMFNLMMHVHDQGNSRDHFRAKAVYAQAGLERPTEIPVGIALTLLKTATFAELQTDVQRDPAWPGRRRRLTQLWLRIFASLHRQVDPDWDPDDAPPMHPDLPGVTFDSGVAPNGVVDPRLSEKHAVLIEQHRQRHIEFSRQRTLRSLLDRPGRDLPKYLVKMYARTPIAKDELGDLLRQHPTTWDGTAASILRTVAHVNRILPDGVRSKLLLLEADFGASGPAHMADLLNLLEDRKALSFARKDAISGLAMLSDDPAHRIDPDHVEKTAITLAHVAADPNEPEAIRNHASAWLGRYTQLLASMTARRPQEDAGTAPAATPEELRALGQAQLRAGEYDAMIQTYSGLEDSKHANIDDVLWLAHGYHLNQQWQKSGEAMQRALRQFDVDLQRMDQEIRSIRNRKDDNTFDRSGPGREGQIRYIEQQQERLRERWPGLVLMTGQMQLLQLRNAKAAVETLNQGQRYAPIAVHDFETLVANAKRALAKENLDPKRRLWSQLMMPVANLRYQAMAHEALGNVTEAADCWCRVRLLEICYRVALAWVDREHLLKLLDRIPAEDIAPHHQFVRNHPGEYQTFRPRTVTRRTLVPEKETTPLQATWLNGEASTKLGPGHPSIVRLQNGQFMLAFTSGDWQQHGIRFSMSPDGTAWVPSWPLPHNDIFDTRAPSLLVDDAGVIWLLFTSKRFDLAKRYSSGGYRLWLTHSRDGHNWSKIQPVWTPSYLQYQHAAQLTRDHDGRFWIFCNEYFGSGDSPDKIRELTVAAFAPSPETPVHVCNSHAVFDAAGTCHLVYDNFGRGLHYVRSQDTESWSEAVEIDAPKKSSSISFPQLVLHDGKGILINHANSGLWRRSVDLTGDQPTFGTNVTRLADHVATAAGGWAFQHEDTIYIPAGAYTPGVLTSSVSDLLDAD